MIVFWTELALLTAIVLWGLGLGDQLLHKPRGARHAQSHRQLQREASADSTYGHDLPRPRQQVHGDGHTRAQGKHARYP
jgi:hypothetical protein